MKTKRVAKECPQCGVLPGRLHTITCPLQQCPYTGRTGRTPAPLDDRLPRTGLRPGVAECREHGLYARRVHGFWFPCHKSDPGAVPDLKRLRTYGRWNRDTKRFVWGRRCSIITLEWEWDLSNDYTVLIRVVSQDGEQAEDVNSTICLENSAADALYRLRIQIGEFRKEGWSFPEEVLVSVEDFLDEWRVLHKSHGLGEEPDGEDEDEDGDE